MKLLICGLIPGLISIAIFLYSSVPIVVMVMEVVDLAMEDFMGERDANNCIHSRFTLHYAVLPYMSLVALLCTIPGIWLLLDLLG